ncbi:MAG TPA: B12-binding domain-containing radical SAM protein [Candidatus Atribacteria bacterium]|nr:B12-binding domain-containing radical SAM protein [Candidatus Atribacteria bacterium]
MNTKRILLIQPNAEGHFNKLYAKFFLIPPLSLQQFVTCTPSNYEVKIVDERFEKIEYDHNYDLIGLTFLTKDAFRAYEIADEFRSMGKKVVLGGIHPTLLPNEAKQHADSVITGEAEFTWQKLLKDFEKGKIKPFYKSKEKVKPKNIPPAKRYNKFFMAGIQATRGCPFKCDFCQRTALNDTVHRKREIDEVIKELKSIESKIIWFRDASLTIDVEYTKKLLRRMIEEKLNKRWFAYATTTTLGKDDELLKLASKAGCVAWMVGFETISNYNFPKNRGADFSKVVEKVGKHGMGICGSFIFGFDNDTPETFDRTYEEVSSWELESAEFNILTPLPKTPLFEKLDREKRILTKDWSKYNLANVVFQPKNLTAGELKEGVKKISQKFYAIPSMLKRMTKPANKSKNLLSILFRISTNLDLRYFHKLRVTKF